MKLDNAYEAATKCLEFPEVFIFVIYSQSLIILKRFKKQTRQEAQSLLNQIAQTRNSFKEQESVPFIQSEIAIVSSVEMEVVQNINDSSKILSSNKFEINNKSK